MAGLIGTGRETLAQANRGLADLSAVETQRRAARDQMEANVRSQQAAVGGIGTAVFGPKLVGPAGKAAGAVLSPIAKPLAAKGVFGSQIAGDLAALNSAFGGASAGAGASAAGAGAAGAGSAAAGGAAAAGGVGAGAAGGAAAGAGAAGAAGAAAGGAAGAAAGGAAGAAGASAAAGGAAAAGMAAAAPWVLLALGGAYLVGKMFD